MFKIDLLPTRLGSFDVIVGMDWLSYHRAVIVCYEKIVRVPLPNGEILEIHCERPKKDPKSLSCIKANEKRLDDIRTVRDFPEVFSDDLTKELNMQQSRWSELLSDYECEIKYHPGKANVVADALSRKERLKPRVFEKTHDDLCCKALLASRRKARVSEDVKKP
nr:putative reverse transcriptase domain-containing protein [Tanacetum cinerariifolium]